MQIEIPQFIVKEYITAKKLSEEAADDRFGSSRWGSTQTIVLTDTKDDQAFAKDLNIFITDARKDLQQGSQKQQTYRATADLKTYFAVLDKDFSTRVRSLRGLPALLISYLKAKTLDGCMWLVGVDKISGQSLYYVVTSIVFCPARSRRDGDQDHVTLTYMYNALGKRENGTISWFKEDLKKYSNVVELFASRDMIPFTETDVATYNHFLNVLFKYIPKTGEQFKLTGIGVSYGERSYWHSNGAPVNFSIDTEFTKAVLDDFDVENESNRGGDRAVNWVDVSFSAKVEVDDDEEEEEEEEDNIISPTTAGSGLMSHGDMVKVPYHAKCRLFSLVHHDYVICHVADMEEYEYDEKLIDKLVLDDDVKDLVGFLVESVGEKMSDIVAGKSAGVIIAALGLPGVGKTLTGEVFSEKIKRPLYVVQASQLGVELNGLEDKLKIILRRANRWRAILTIDEADVYIHARGSDLVQNAVVGIFLRVLEYYSGVLFMTSNRSTTIDDAILSRCNAVINYQAPNPEQQVAIWKVLSREFNHEISNAFIVKVQELVGTDITGREIKNLLKLGILRAKKINNGLLTPEIIHFVSKYQNYVVRKG